MDVVDPEVCRVERELVTLTKFDYQARIDLCNSPATRTASSLKSPSLAARRTNSLRQPRADCRTLGGHCQSRAYSTRCREAALSREFSFTWPLEDDLFH